MLRDLSICVLSTLNVLIFSFVILNGEALKKVDAFSEARTHSGMEFDQVTQQVQQGLRNDEGNRRKKLRFSATNEIAAVAVLPRNDIPSPASTLTIPAIKVSAPITFHESLTSDEAQKKLEQGAISLSPFLSPSQPGRNILFGHSSDYPWRHNEYANLFTLLPQLKQGDLITIQNDRHIYKYAVERTVITPTDLGGVIDANLSGNELILTTCYPIGFFSKRFNVVAKPITHSSP